MYAVNRGWREIVQNSSCTGAAAPAVPALRRNTNATAARLRLMVRLRGALRVPAPEVRVRRGTNPLLVSGHTHGKGGGRACRAKCLPPDREGGGEEHGGQHSIRPHGPRRGRDRGGTGHRARDRAG